MSRCALLWCCACLLACTDPGVVGHARERARDAGDEPDQQVPTPTRKQDAGRERDDDPEDRPTACPRAAGCQQCTGDDDCDDGDCVEGMCQPDEPDDDHDERKE